MLLSLCVEPCVAESRRRSEVFATQEVNYSPHSICYSRRHQVVFYLMTDGVYRTVHLVLRLYLSSGCCRSFTKAPEDSLSVHWDKYLFSITMKLSSVFFSVTVVHCRKQLKLEVTAFVWSHHSGAALSGLHWSSSASDEHQERTASTCTLAHMQILNEDKQRGLKMPSLLQLPTIISPPNIPLKHPVLVFSCFLNLPSLPFLEI